MVTRVCLSEAAFPHYCTDPDVTWGNGRECPVVVHYWADLQSVHGFHCYDNIARTRNVSECSYSLYAWLSHVTLVVRGSTYMNIPLLEVESVSIYSLCQFFVPDRTTRRINPTFLPLLIPYTMTAWLHVSQFPRYISLSHCVFHNFARNAQFTPTATRRNSTSPRGVNCVGDSRDRIFPMVSSHVDYISGVRD